MTLTLHTVMTITDGTKIDVDMELRRMGTVVDRRKSMTAIR